MTTDILLKVFILKLFSGRNNEIILLSFIVYNLYSIFWVDKRFKYVSNVL